jgi:hypothetical protein
MTHPRRKLNRAKKKVVLRNAKRTGNWWCVWARNPDEGGTGPGRHCFRTRAEAEKRAARACRQGHGPLVIEKSNSTTGKSRIYRAPAPCPGRLPKTKKRARR